MLPAKGTIRLREIAADDLEALAQLLPRGFPNRSPAYFRMIFERLAGHRTPSKFPKYGYLMESNGVPVGAILMIYSSMIAQGEARIRGNGAYWYVEPEFRTGATLLFKRARARKDVTYLNLSPGRHTLPILAAQGYECYLRGEFMALAALSVRNFGAQVRAVTPDGPVAGGVTAFEADLLRDHARFGCIALTCTAGDETHPLVFERRLRSGRIRVPYARLVYCRSVEALVRLAGPVGRYLALRGIPLVCIDSNGPVPGLLGSFSTVRTPKFFNGPHRPRLGDFAYTERVMFDN